MKSHGGRAVQSKSGHAFIKQRMREVDGVYGGEMSAHHYFRDFSYCDSGMIPWLLVTQLMCESGQRLSELVGERIRRFPASGEINRRVPDGAATIERVLASYRPKARSEDLTDGVSLEFDAWRFNLRTSNTEPLIRLNVESRGDAGLDAREDRGAARADRRRARLKRRRRRKPQERLIPRRREGDGAQGRTRTTDLLHTKQVLFAELPGHG